jgi:hypothetical protein
MTKKSHFTYQMITLTHLKLGLKFHVYCGLQFVVKKVDIFVSEIVGILGEHEMPNFDQVKMLIQQK